MTKVITDIELLKKLAPHLGDVETEYYLNYKGEVKENIFNEGFLKTVNGIKTLTTDEALEFLYKNKIGLEITTGSIDEKNKLIYSIRINIENKTFLGYDLLEEIEKILHYLLNNNLLGTKNT